jgi:hypothetical protein
MTLKDVVSILEKKLKHYPRDSARGGDTYDNGIHTGLKNSNNII